jgi:thioredoxin 1
MSHVRSLDAATFDRAIAAGTPVLVDFFATWCPPCKALAPVLDQLAGELGDRIAFYKVNVDEEPELAGRFQVRAVPTIAVFLSGKQVSEIPGYVPAAKLRTFLESVARAGSTVARDPS